MPIIGRSPRAPSSAKPTQHDNHPVEDLDQALSQAEGQVAATRGGSGVAAEADVGKSKGGIQSLGSSGAGGGAVAVGKGAQGKGGEGGQGGHGGGGGGQGGGVAGP